MNIYRLKERQAAVDILRMVGKVALTILFQVYRRGPRDGGQIRESVDRMAGLKDQVEPNTVWR